MTIEEAERAVYLDFESNANKPASLAGVLIEDGFEQVVLEDALHCVLSAYLARPHTAPTGYRPLGIVTAGRSPTLSVQTSAEFARGLVSRCERERRLIVTWSSFETGELKRMAPALTESIDRVVLDIKRAAKSWKRSHHPGVVFRRLPWRPQHQLKRYLRLIGYDMPRHLGDRQAAGRLSDVRGQLATRNGDFSRVTRVAKAKWTKLLDYNWHDCCGLRELTLTIARDQSVLESDLRDRASA